MPHHHDHDHGHHHDHHDLRAAAGRALWIALVVLAVFFGVELAGGLVTNSLALISDAFHLLTDVAAIALALFARWFASKEPTPERSFGYRRAEILAALVNGGSLVLIAGYIVHEAIDRLLDPPAVAGLPLLVVAGVGLVAQAAVAAILARSQKGNLNVRGAYLHALTDAIQSIGVVGAGVVVITTGWYLVDPIVSLLIAAMVAYGGVRVVREAVHVLLEGTPRDLELARVRSWIEEEEGVDRVTDLHVWALTSGYNALTAHVIAASGQGYEELCIRLTRRLRGSFPVHHVTLQIERDCELCRSGDCGGWLAAGEQT